VEIFSLEVALMTHSYKYTDLASHFTKAELSTIEACARVDPDGDARDALRISTAWAAHVDKLDRDRDLPHEDRSVWNEYDLVAALTMRDILASALALLPADLATRVEKLTTSTDDRFRSFTSEDSGIRITKIAEVSPEGRGWWWYRIPTDGPIAVDLAHYNADGNYIATPPPQHPLS
jgi:hypothetical protein